MAKDDAEKRGKRQKKQEKAAEEDEPAVAPDALPERLQGHHRYVTCGADMNFHVRRRLYRLLPELCRNPSSDLHRDC